MRSVLFLAAAALFCPTASFAQNAGLSLPVQELNSADQMQAFLPANTELRLQTVQEVTTKGNTWSEGDTFNLSVTHDVIEDGYLVIPRGSRAIGRITWMTDKGAFGKSGKMDIELEYVEVAGRRIDVIGTYRQEGEGNTVATVGGVIVAGIFAGFITGKSATIPRGRELVAYTQADLPLALPARNRSVQEAHRSAREQNERLVGQTD